MMPTLMNRVAVVLCCSLAASSAMADAAFRCGGRLIEPGLTQVGGAADVWCTDVKDRRGAGRSQRQPGRGQDGGAALDV